MALTDDKPSAKGNEKEYKSAAERLNELTEKLKEGIKNLMSSDKYKSYLSTMSKFHRYSTNNTILIAMQKPDATLVAGYDSWKNKFGRQVNKGEKGIKIIAPMPYKKMVEEEVKDKFGKVVLDNTGKPLTVTKEITIPVFQSVTVFDLAQTSGKELPSIGVNELNGKVDNFKDLITALERVSPVPVERIDIASGAKGYFSPAEQKIAIQKGMSEAQEVKTLIHEISHSLVDDKDNVRIEGLENTAGRTRNDKEVTAESVAFVVSEAVGNIDTSDYSFGYIAGWSAGKDADELKNSMDTIKVVSSKLITDIEDELKQISLEKENAVTYEIYQLKDDIEDHHFLAFESIDHLNNMGFSVNKENYEMVYSGSLKEGEGLENLYEKFNTERPDDFRGHSMSVSDVIVTKGADGEQAHFVDTVGMTAVTVFLMDQSMASHREAAVVVGDNFIEAHRCDEGMDYSVYGPDMKLIDGGVIENKTITPVMAVNEIINAREITGVIECLDHQRFCENAEKANRIEAVSETKDVAEKKQIQAEAKGQEITSGHNVQKSEKAAKTEKLDKKPAKKKSLKESLNEKKEKVASTKTAAKSKQKNKAKGEER